MKNDNGDTLINNDLSGIRSDYFEYILASDEHVGVIDASLEFIGKKFSSDRVYIFEFDTLVFSNTYEWCASGIEPQKDFLQNESIELIRIWIDEFEAGRPVVISDVNLIATSSPHIYAALVPQDIHSLVACPLKQKGEVIGFIGVDNPVPSQVDFIIEFLSDISLNLLSYIKSDRQIKQLRYVSRHDGMTSALNRYAYSEIHELAKNAKSLGIVYCDISNLKAINDIVGHDAGDAAIIECYNMIKKAFPYANIYRVGGDEFVVVCIDTPRKLFFGELNYLKSLIKESYQHLAIGESYQEGINLDIPKMISSAETTMYADKDQYYAHQVINTPDNTRPAHNSLSLHNHSHTHNKYLLSSGPETEFDRFVSNNFFNAEVLIRSVALVESQVYIYFGDLQTNIFYISDNTKEMFGFQNNVVPNWLHYWGNLIGNKEEREIYFQDIDDIRNARKDNHDLRYRVRDIFGNDVWIHCRGEVMWNEDRTMPLFFSGCMTRQENEFIVDPITNFLREAAAIKKLFQYREKHNDVTVIGLSLNSFSLINELYGKSKGDDLLSDLSKALIDNFDEVLHFYRLDGLRFIAIVQENTNINVDQVVNEIRSIVSQKYKSHGVNVKNPCSTSILSASPHEIDPQKIISNTIVLLNIAKTSKENGSVIHSEHSIKEQQKQAEMLFELTKNVQDNFENFRVVVQPTYLAKNHKIFGGEVLLRWKFKGQNVPPNVFIPLLENNGMIVATGKWVFEQAVKISRRVSTLNPSLETAFNVSYIQVVDPEFFPYMKMVLETYGIKASSLVLELTETNFDDSPQKLSTFFENCIELGINVALDDFGNGYSSLGMLLKYPTSIVKLDKSVLNEMTASDDNKKFVKSIVYACHAFDKLVCAEGIETEAELQLMKDSGCDIIQGYYFAKPLELPDYFKLIVEEKKDFGDDYNI